MDELVFIFPKYNSNNYIEFTKQDKTHNYVLYYAEFSYALDCVHTNNTRHTTSFLAQQSSYVHLSTKDSQQSYPQYETVGVFQHNIHTVL